MTDVRRAADGRHVADARIAEAGVLLVVLCWGANFVVVKAVIGELPPLVFTMLRYLLATASVVLVLRLRNGSIGFGSRDAVRVAALGVLGFGIYQVLWTLGLSTITAGDSSLLIVTTPVLVALIAAAIGTDSLTVGKLLGALLAFAGVAIVIASGQELTLGASLVGDALTLGAALSWAIYTAAMGRVMRRQDPLQATAWALTGGAIFLVPLGLYQAAITPDLQIRLADLGGIAYSGILAAGIANVLILRGVKILGPTRVTVLQYFVPAVAVVLAAVFLNEPVRLAQIAGGAVIVAGVAVTRLAAASRPISLRPRISSS